jgi:DNA-directed RNA polymerase specialized sigma54-like protein
MSNSKQIIESLFADDLYTAKKAITEVLTSKMAQALEEKLIDFAPEVFNEGSKPDFLDLDKDGNKKEPMRKAARDKNKVGQRVNRVNMKEDIEDLAEDFENQLKSLVEEIEEETGEQLSEEEIIDIANMLIDMIAEDHVDGDEDHDDDEDDDDEDQPTATNYRLGNTPEY